MVLLAHDDYAQIVQSVHILGMYLQQIAERVFRVAVLPHEQIGTRHIVQAIGIVRLQGERHAETRDRVAMILPVLQYDAEICMEIGFVGYASDSGADVLYGCV